jgi:molecular chaperone GrpE
MEMSNETERAAETEQTDGADSAVMQETEEQSAPDWTPEQVEQWREQAGKAQEHWDRLVRVSADFDNYKKRAARERQEAVRFANESLLQKLLPVLDSFEMALAATNNPPGHAADALKTGVDMIQNQLRTILAEAGLEEIDATGKPFDPNWHEAVSQLPSAEVPEGNVLQQIRKGFKLNERLIRPASVVVAKKPG